MKFIFKVNEIAIISQLIYYKLLPSKLLQTLQEKFAEEIKLISKQQLLFNKQQVPQLFSFCKNQPEIQKQIQKCKENAQRIESNVQKHQPSLDTFVTRLAKTELPFAETIDVYILPLGGWYMKSKNSILWGGEKGYENFSYDLIYLNHERMHSITKNSDISHVVIECFDKEINKKVFNNAADFIQGHSFLRDLHYKILPFWNLYTNKPIRDIQKQNKQTNFSYAIEKFEPLRGTLSAMNVYEFISFLENIHVDQMPLNKQHILQATLTEPTMLKQGNTYQKASPFALQFTVNKPFLLASLLKTQDLPVPLLNALWLHHEDDYRAVLNLPLSKIPQDLALFTEMEQANEVTQIIKNCQKYANELQNAFTDVEQKIQTYLTNILKFTSTATNAQIYIGYMQATPYTQGVCMADANNKQDVALTMAQSIAQSLHNTRHAQNKVLNALVEIITNELYFIFTNKYMEAYGTNELEEIRLKILPWWNLYTQKNEQDIKNICSCYHVEYNPKVFEKYQNSLKNMDFDNFSAFLQDNALKTTDIHSIVQLPDAALSCTSLPIK